MSVPVSFEPVMASRHVAAIRARRDAWIWLIAIAAFVLFWQFGENMRWGFDYPRAWQVPAARWIGMSMKWLVDERHLRPVHLH